jgi:hypothetical protein
MDYFPDALPVKMMKSRAASGHLSVGKQRGLTDNPFRSSQLRPGVISRSFFFLPGLAAIVWVILPITAGIPLITSRRDPCRFLMSSAR